MKTSLKINDDRSIHLKHILQILNTINGITKANAIYKQSGSVKRINKNIFIKVLFTLLSNKKIAKKEIKTYLKARKSFEWFKITSQKCNSKNYTLSSKIDYMVLGLPQFNNVSVNKTERKIEQINNLLFDVYYNNLSVKHLLKKLK